jgi:hypothetical protein
MPGARFCLAFGINLKRREYPFLFHREIFI